MILFEEETGTLLHVFLILTCCDPFWIQKLPFLFEGKYGETQSLPKKEKKMKKRVEKKREMITATAAASSNSDKRATT